MPAPENMAISGSAPPFLAMLEHVSRAAPLSKPVLVIGERGTGKELVAARLHYLSTRWEQPLVKLNCAALTESLLESELFGHEAGAFTGAERQHRGRFERANGGTFFLDELGNIPLRMQEQILRVIEYGEFERVGGSDTVTVDVRILGATNENLPELASQGKFRMDLLDRLAFDVINVPPLRARMEDILPLANHFAVNITAELKRAFFPGFSHRAASVLLTHDWPGNVRELRYTVERSVYRAEHPAEPVSRIEFNPFESPYAAPASRDAAPDAEMPGRTPLSKYAKAALPVDFRDTVRRVEVGLVARAMARSRYNQKRAAEFLGLTYHQLRGVLRKHGLTAQYGRARRTGR